MKKSSGQFMDILIRYLILIVVALPHLWIFYFLFAPLTIYPVYFLLNLFFNSSLIGEVVLVEDCFPIEMVGACIAGSAYYLLLMLNLSTPKIKFRKRINMIFLSFISLLLINILRIFLLSLIFISGSPWYDATHKLFWYSLSIIFVVGIWFTEVKYFKIKEVPFYSDIRFLYKNSLLNKKSSKKKKIN